MNEFYLLVVLSLALASLLSADTCTEVVRDATEHETNQSSQSLEMGTARKDPLARGRMLSPS